MQGHIGAYLLVFAGSILEGDATLLSASFLAHRGHLNLLAVIATAGVATILFNELVFHVARSRGKSFVERKAAGHPRYHRMCGWVQRRGIPLLLFSRYIFGFRTAIPAACGVAGMNPVAFFVTNVAGAVLWTIPVALAGAVIASALEAVWGQLRDYEWHIAIVILAVIWTLLAFKDPELRVLSAALGHSRAFAIWSLSRMRKLSRGRTSTGVSCP